MLGSDPTHEGSLISSALNSPPHYKGESSSIAAASLIARRASDQLIAFQVARIVPHVRNLKAGGIPRRAPPWPPSGCLPLLIGQH
jgi:hypothetical protein